MGLIKSTFGILGMAALGIGAFEAAQGVPLVLHHHAATSSAQPKVRTIQWSPGKTSSNPGTPNPPPQAPAATGTPTSINANSLNWAGLVQEGSSEKSVEASWVVPSFSAAPRNPHSAVAEWIGLGGMESNALIQVGTITSAGASGQATTTVFWEKLPQSAVQTATVPSGSTINAKIIPTKQKNQWRLVLSVKGQSKPLISKVLTLTPAQAQAVETSADWITEAPTTNNGVVPLAPVTATTMTQVQANGVPLAKMAASSLQSIGLYSPNGELLAAPTRNASKDTLTVNTIYGSLPAQGLSPGGLQPPTGSNGYGDQSPWGDGWGDTYPGSSGGYPMPGQGGFTWSVNF